MTPELPPAPPPRRVGPILAALACWLIGGHALIAPGVIAYVLAVLCLDEGVGNVLGSAAGLRLAATVGLSLASSLDWLFAGLLFHRAHWRSGGWHVATASALALAAIAMVLVG